MIEFYATLAFLGLSAFVYLVWSIRREARFNGEAIQRLYQAEDAARKARVEAEIHARPSRSKPDLVDVLRKHAE